MISPVVESLDENNITGIILIDCWEPRADKALKIVPWHQQIVTYCNTLDIKCVVNSAYNSMLDYNIFYDGDRSHYNTMKLYNGLDSRYHDLSRGTGSDFDISQRGNCVMQNILRYSAGMNRTSKTIKEITNNDHSIFLLTVEDLEHHWTWHLNRQVTNWFVTGQTWQMCTHLRPMGFAALSEFSRRSGCKFYTAPWAVLDDNLEPVTQQHFEEDFLTWKSTNNGSYCLEPQ